LSLSRRNRCVDEVMESFARNDGFNEGNFLIDFSIPSKRHGRLVVFSCLQSFPLNSDEISSSPSIKSHTENRSKT
jgi:hypothetical protein